ncbi:MAG: patatin-like phospholipase family protein [bacterium]
MSKVGLVLEGGAMRGLFSAGVMDVMMEAGLTFDGAIGVSAGACFGCNYKSEQIGRALRYNKTYCQDPRYGSFSSFLKTGDLYEKDFCYHDLPDHVDAFDSETFTKNPMAFYVTATDVTTGRAVYHRMEKVDYEEMEWIRASAAMPIVSQIVEVGGYKLLDGGVSDSIPLRHFETIGYDRNVVILTQAPDYQKEKNKLLPLIKVVLRRYPKMIEALKYRHHMYNATLHYIHQREQDGDVFVIQPEVSLNVKSPVHDPDEIQRIYDLGVEMGLKRLEALKAFLSKKE